MPLVERIRRRLLDPPGRIFAQGQPYWALSQRAQGNANDPAAGRFYLTPIPIPAPVSVQIVKIQVTTAGGAGEKADLGRYEPTTPDHREFHLVQDYGELDISSTGVKTKSRLFGDNMPLDILEPGTAWLGIGVDSGTAVLLGGAPMYTSEHITVSGLSAQPSMSYEVGSYTGPLSTNVKPIKSVMIPMIGLGVVAQIAGQGGSWIGNPMRGTHPNSYSENPLDLLIPDISQFGFSNLYLLAIPKNSRRAMRQFAPTPRVITGLSVIVTTAKANSDAIMGVYTDDGGNPPKPKRLLGSGTVTTTSTGERRTSVGNIPVHGHYWVAYVNDIKNVAVDLCVTSQQLATHEAFGPNLSSSRLGNIAAGLPDPWDDLATTGDEVMIIQYFK